ncbi:odorant receptor 131-2-like [Leptodactylus fuscus]|uniref:odorant receptor 131-2-like n=1 Tax=Leptodactylus fuscus TaxID=238119 RepID=UPI003F4E9C3E
MFNITGVNNSTSMESMGFVRSILLSVMLLSFCVFIYFVTIILHAFFTNPHIRENSRYVLFIHMLINDALLLSVLIFLFLMSRYLIFIPVPICYALLTFSINAFRVTPYNLAIMSLERFFAISYPLRHAEICTRQRSLLAIAAMWLLNLIPHFVDFIAMCYSMPKNFFTTKLECLWQEFAMNRFQVILRPVTDIATFMLVGLVILYTYVKVMIVARRIGSGKSSAFKAKKTVLLHALQLGLCMMAFTSSTTDSNLREYYYLMPLTNFFLFMCIPRFISPLIYGIRDEVFRKHMRKMNFSI